jgi:hypothetical protein
VHVATPSLIICPHIAAHDLPFLKPLLLHEAILCRKNLLGTWESLLLWAQLCIQETVGMAFAICSFAKLMCPVGNVQHLSCLIQRVNRKETLSNVFGFDDPPRNGGQRLTTLFVTLHGGGSLIRDLSQAPPSDRPLQSCAGSFLVNVSS